VERLDITGLSLPLIPVFMEGARGQPLVEPHATSWAAGGGTSSLIEPLEDWKENVWKK